MGERMRNCCHILMVPLWRRKYFLVSAGLLWAVFYIYVHYVNGPNQMINGSVEHGVDVSITTGSMSAKLPVDLAMMMEDSRKINVADRERFLITKSTKAPNPSRPIGKPSITAKQEEGILRPPESRYPNAIAASDAQNNAYHEMHVDPSLDTTTRRLSLKERFTLEGIEPTSIIIRPKEESGENAANKSGELSNATPFIPPLRCVHFDLKGAPPKIAYFKSIFPLIKNAGANGIILEYEDTFPFTGSLAVASAGNAYKQRDIRHILEMAQSHQLQVIPLVQTFGHLEFVLKLPQFKHLREVEDSPQALCPTNNGSLDMVKSMIDQVMALHSNSKWLHIGSDEVFHLGHCRRCSKYDRNSLFLAHVRKVAKHVREVHNVIPIMWDDMLRHISVPELEKYELGKLVEPMVWTYVEEVYVFIPDSLWLKYGQVFGYVWTASAFKGAFGETLTVPDAKRHLENNKSWLNVMREQNKNFKGFRGIAVTGWQRYDHFASLCELLPAGLPSLVMNLLMISQGNFDETVFPKMQEILDCSSRKHYHLDLEHDPFLWRALGVCFFPGSSVFRLTLRHSDVSKSIDKFIYDTTVHKGWMTEYNVNHNFTSPTRVNELLKEYSYHNSSLQMLLDAAVKALREVFDDYTVNEWIELNIFPYIKKMKKIWDTAASLKKFEVWPRRPLPKTMKLPPPGIDFGFIKS